MTEADIEDISGDIWLGWNATTLFIAARMEYATHSNPALIGADLWQGSAWQLQVGGVLNPSHMNDGRNELGFALGTNPPRQLAHAWFTAGPTGDQGFNATMSPGENFVVRRDGNITYYEIAIPFSTQTTTIDALEEGMLIPFSQDRKSVV